jgi:hypothetical protein
LALVVGRNLGLLSLSSWITLQVPPSFFSMRQRLVQALVSRWASWLGRSAVAAAAQ